MATIHRRQHLQHAVNKRVPAECLPGELVQLLPLGASLVPLDGLERLLRGHSERKPRKHSVS